MKGSAKCSFQSQGKEDLHYEDVILTFVSEDRVAIIARPDLREPKELLTLECAHIDILSSSQLELEGFATLKEHNEAFIKCSVEFFPYLKSEHEAA